MNGIHEVTGSIPVWSTNLRSRSQAEVVHRSLASILPSGGGPPAVSSSYGWQAAFVLSQSSR
jgi:hypothetical protein